MCCAIFAKPATTYFGTVHPTRADIEAADEYWEDLERGKPDMPSFTRVASPARSTLPGTHLTYSTVSK